MPVYHFTLHAYRTWSPSHPRGFVQRKRGIQPTNLALAREYDRVARDAPVLFNDHLQNVLICGLIDICSQRGWRLHQVATDPTHLHFVVSWRGFMRWEQVRAKVKNLLSLLLGRFTGETRHWFVRHGSRKRVKDPSHLKHLLDRYLPDHRGRQWKEGEGKPMGFDDVINRGLPPAAIRR